MSAFHVNALKSAAATMLTAQSEIGEAVAEIASVLDAVEWTGPERERFVAEWGGVHGPALLGVCGDLETSAERAHTVASMHARELAGDAAVQVPDA